MRHMTNQISMIIIGTIHDKDLKDILSHKILGFEK
jgi:hypothetical protein